MSSIAKRQRRADKTRRRRLARKLAVYSIAAGAAAFVGNAAEATVSVGFTGDYAPANWGTSHAGPNFSAVTHTASQLTIARTEHNMYYYSGVNWCTVNLTAGIPEDATIDFDWQTSFNYAVIGRSGYDWIWLNDHNASGHITVNKLEGNGLMFIEQEDYGNVFQRYYGYPPFIVRLEITNFTVTTAGAVIPEPEALGALALGAIGLSSLRRRRS